MINIVLATRSFCDNLHTFFMLKFNSLNRFKFLFLGLENVTQVVESLPSKLKALSSAARIWKSIQREAPMHSVLFGLLNTQW
jgi:hypothetical protein